MDIIHLFCKCKQAQLKSDSKADVLEHLFTVRDLILVQKCMVHKHLHSILLGHPVISLVQ